MKRGRSKDFNFPRKNPWCMVRNKSWMIIISCTGVITVDWGLGDGYERLLSVMSIRKDVSVVIQSVNHYLSGWILCNLIYHSKTDGTGPC